VDLYHEPDAWQQIVLKGMAQNFDWQHSALAYNDLYERARARTI
jgi:glycogen synthase